MIRVFQFNLQPPTENAEIVALQIRRAHDYRNDLIQIERGRRAAMRALETSTKPLEDAARKADVLVEQIAKALKGARGKTRTRADSPDLTRRLTEARAARYEARRELFEARKDLRAGGTLKADQQRINDIALELKKNAREHCGVYWGSYLLVESAMEQAIKMTPLYDADLPNDPEFRRWSGGDIGGRLGVQIQAQADKPPFLVDHVASYGNKHLRIESVPYRLPAGREGQPLSQRAQKYQDAHKLLHMRVDSSETGKPIWATWPMTLHRPLPLGAVIKGAVVRRKTVGSRETWKVTITVDAMARAEECGANGAVAIDLGWRAMTDANGNTEIRVATWRGEDGASGELRLSAWDLGGIRKADDLRSIRDQVHDSARASLVEFLKDPGCTVPAWLREATRYIHEWKAPRRLMAVIDRWRKERFPGDEKIMGEPPTFGPRAAGHRGRAERTSFGSGLLAWGARERFGTEKHLSDWEANQREQALLHRREVYRVFAKKLARRYSTLVIEEFDLRVFKKTPKVATPAEKEDNRRARANQQRVAVGELRLVLVNAFQTRGGRDEYEPAMDTTRKCNVCGSVETFDAAKEIRHTCQNGHAWDQDDNAAINLLARHRQRMQEMQDKEAPSGPQKRESKWAKAKRKKAQGQRESPQEAERIPPQEVQQVPQKKTG